MTKEQKAAFLQKCHDLRWTQSELEEDLALVIQTAIAEHDKAILDDIDFGYDLEMIKGKLINKSYCHKNRKDY
jgi:hypothetical protein